MKLTCPYCGNKFDIDASARTETLLNLTQALDGFGPHRSLVWEYTDAFAAQRLGPVAPAKRLRIVTEFARLWESGVFQVDGKRYKISRDGIVAGLRTVCDLEKYGFKNHNYLKKILMQQAEKISAEGLTAEEERALEDSRRHRCPEPERAEVPPGPEALERYKKEMGVTKLSELIRKKVKQVSGVRCQGKQVSGVRCQDSAGADHDREENR
jgi:hypothetical protein